MKKVAKREDFIFCGFRQVRRGREGSDAGWRGPAPSAAVCVLVILEPPIDIVRQRMVIICNGSSGGVRKARCRNRGPTGRVYFGAFEAVFGSVWSK